MPIIHLNDWQSMKPLPEYIFVVNDIEAQMASIIKGAEVVRFGDARYSASLYKTLMEHLPELWEVYESLIDEESKKTFFGYWLAKLSYNTGKAHFAKTPQYICAGFMPEAGDILIDGGTCDGYTAARLTGLGCKVIGFEMDKHNYKLAAEVAKKYDFIVENLGLGSYQHEENYVHYSGNIGASRLGQGGQEITNITTLDIYAAEHKLPRIDFIKLDVEGSELNILRGAATSIAKWKPKLAISAYHKDDDFWVLMNFIKSVRPDYEFALRHYGSSRMDLPFLLSLDLENIFFNLGVDVTLQNTCECVLLCR